MTTLPLDRPAGLWALRHIAGDSGLPFVGHALEFVSDPRGLLDRMHARFGACYRTQFLGIHNVTMLGEDALELVLRDRGEAFSNEHGWGFSLGRLFPNGLMLRDFAVHRHHRRIMQRAFRKTALEGYLDGLNERIAVTLPTWAEVRDFHFYPRIKALTLDNAASLFLGLELGPEAEALNRAFVDTVEATLALVRVPIPGLKLSRGLRGRALLVDFLRRHIAQRRASPEQRDMFSQLCHATDEEGERFGDDEVVDHLVFLLMAAHDTVTSALTSTAYRLAANPVWQDRLREESRALGAQHVGMDDLPAMELHQRVFDEVLRLDTPVPYIPRRTTKRVMFRGHAIPAGAHVSVVPDFTHRDPRLYRDPERFDPSRFESPRAEHRQHPYAFVPYGGGAHTCIGRAFAYLLVKAFLHPLLLRYRLRLPEGRKHVMRRVPIPKPTDDLPLILEPV